MARAKVAQKAAKAKRTPAPRSEAVKGKAKANAKAKAKAKAPAGRHGGADEGRPQRISYDVPMKPAKGMRSKEGRDLMTIVGKPELINSRGNKSRKVLVLYTGGTLGMQPLPDGTLGPVVGALGKSLRSLTELDNPRIPQCFFVEFHPILDSADMGPNDWTSVATAIHRWYYDFDGFVVLHGTDTMAYTTSALSFMLEQLAKPVVVTGAQLPIFEPISDARQNFLGAVVFAGLADISEVCLFFNGQLLRGNRAVKASASALNAFQSPCYPGLAELGVPIQIFRRRLQPPPNGRFRLQEIHVTDVLVVWVIPGFADDMFQHMLKGKTLKGMVLLLYGCGNAPARKQKFLAYLKQLVDKGVVIVACSQCTTGTVQLEKYSVGKAFQNVGVVGGHDMTVEAAVTKLAYLLSKGLPPGEVRALMSENLRGEITTEATSFSIAEPATGISAL